MARFCYFVNLPMQILFEGCHVVTKCRSIGQLAPTFSVFPKRPDCEVFLRIYFVLIFRRMKKDEEAVERLVSGLNEWVPDLGLPSHPLVNVATGVVAPSYMVQNVLSAKDRGMKAKMEFISR